MNVEFRWDVFNMGYTCDQAMILQTDRTQNIFLQQVTFKLTAIASQTIIWVQNEWIVSYQFRQVRSEERRVGKEC